MHTKENLNTMVLTSHIIGIGGAVAQRFAKEAFTVALMSRSEGSIKPVYDAIVAVS
jgi:NADP-dependent 3-hydroxy acid dehydrogenase YdfG